jgi:XTP/dITP diphosphohydrolase
MKKFFIASKNSGKIREIRSILEDFPAEILSFNDIPGIPDIEETGSTLEENALIKAKAVFDIVNIPVLADDSGLEVDFLNGAPGVYSARYSGPDANDDANCKKLLAELGELEFSKRTARFRCVIVMYDGFRERCFEGACEGHIIDYKKGHNGFGYDPIFMPNGYSQTFAELENNIKNRISHRARALNNLKEFLLFNQQT